MFVLGNQEISDLVGKKHYEPTIFRLICLKMQNTKLMQNNLVATKVNLCNHLSCT